MKTAKLLLVFFLFPILLSAQKTLSGVWTGVLNNDSAQARNDQSFELALTEYRGKVYGYSYTTFIAEDKLYYIVKRVKGIIEEGICEIEDDDIVSNNFFEKRDKGVKQTLTFRMNPKDSTWYIDGTWKTNKTRKYYSLTGSLSLKEEKQPEQSPIMQHLTDLKLQNTVTVTEKKEEIKSRETGMAKREDKPAAKNESGSVTSQTPKNETVSAGNSGIGTGEEKKIDGLATVSKNQRPDKTNIPVKENTIAKSEPGSGNTPLQKNESVQDSKPGIQTGQDKKVDAVKTDQKNNTSRDSNAPVRNEDLEKNRKAEPGSRNDAMTTPAQKSTGIKTAPETHAADQVIYKPVAAAEITKRKKETEEIVYFKSDSLLLALYDNGEVDGDTVSVLLNGEIIMANQGLKSTAIKKTIYVPAGVSDSLEIILYAENLGAYPPNTGLLIVYDGTERHLIRFSADFDKNASIILRRKKN